MVPCMLRPYDLRHSLGCARAERHWFGQLSTVNEDFSSDLMYSLTMGRAYFGGDIGTESR